MATTDAQKRASAKWNKANTKNIACTVNLEEHAGVCGATRKNNISCSSGICSQMYF